MHVKVTARTTKSKTSSLMVTESHSLIKIETDYRKEINQCGLKMRVDGTVNTTNTNHSAECTEVRSRIKKLRGTDCSRKGISLCDFKIRVDGAATHATSQSAEPPDRFSRTWEVPESHLPAKVKVTATPRQEMKSGWSLPREEMLL